MVSPTIRNARLDMTPVELEQLLERNKHRQLVTGRWVHIVDTPHETAIALYYERRAEHLHGIFVCCTNEAASQFLGYAIEPYLLH